MGGERPAWRSHSCLSVSRCVSPRHLLVRCRRGGASGCTDAAVEWVKTVRQGVAIEGETQAKAAGAKRVGSMGGGWSES
jgi:hypothetical protein